MASELQERLLKGARMIVELALLDQFIEGNISAEQLREAVEVGRKTTYGEVMAAMEGGGP